MKRCDCGHEISGGGSSVCTRAFCPAERSVVFNGTRALRGLFCATVSIGAMVAVVAALWRWLGC